ncbi:tetratricopeptide repeat protein [Shewanella sp. UCD-KL12]|uniref:tetratricopeptide repeat protein n=1 Tax=Shewanella sp. UCD-KL12 TaxID=1917163 RepID=UPI000970BC3F|nr:tetratricopeptide repeat protein [Shewanella sp. UCD-KL12]
MDRKLANQKLQMGVNLVKQGSYQEALEHLLVLHEIAPREPNILFFTAVSYRHLKEVDRSIYFFEILIQHHQLPGYLCSYANMLLDNNAVAKAKGLLNQAIDIDGNYFDAHYNLARLTQGQLDYSDALTSYRIAHQLKPNHQDAVIGLAQCLVGLGEYKAALYELDRFLNMYPDSIKVLYALACQYAQSKQLEKSASLLLECIEKAPENKVFIVKYASVIADEGQIALAISILIEQLEKAPFDTGIHNALFQIKWLAELEEPFSHFSEAYDREPTNVLTLSFVKKLIKNDELTKAAAKLPAFLLHNPSHVEALTIQAYLERELGDFDKAIKTLKRIPKHAEKLAGVLNEKAITYLCLKQYEAAENIARELVVGSPKNQGWRALLATCLRLNAKSEEYSELYDYDNLVKFFTVNDDCNSNHELKRDLIEIHRAKKHPLEQSLRHGTQTDGQLFDAEIASVDRLEDKIEPVLNTFFESISLDSNHPAFVIDYKSYSYFGSWSVLLNEGGHHLNHFHSEGEFSACYYVSVPEAVKTGGQGWLKLGQPELSRWIKLEPDYYICPKEGSVAVFPSYMWHGTNPVLATCERITVAFDMKRFGH